MPPTLPQANLQEIVEKLQLFLESGACDPRFRYRLEYFTRRRLLPFDVLAVCILSELKRTLGLELEWFFTQLGSPLVPTASAFTQARAKMKPEFFEVWCDFLTSLVYESTHDLMFGLRLVAMDGSMLHLPDSPEIRSFFPPVINHKGAAVMAWVFCCYDVQSQHAIHTRMEPVGESSENRIAASCLELFGSRDLLIYDRLFPGWAMFHLHHLRGIPFVMRCRTNLNKQVAAFVRSGKAEEVIQMKATYKAIKTLEGMGISIKKGQELALRLVRVDLGEGMEPEILATSLMDTKQFPCTVFKEIYACRWGVETFFDRLKNKLQLEVFSGKSVDSIRMDLHATVFLANLQSLFIREAKPQIEESTAGREHEYQPNWNKTLGHMKNALVMLLLNPGFINTLDLLITKITESRNMEPVRKGRRYPRIKKKKQLNCKHHHPPNYKRAI